MNGRKKKQKIATKTRKHKKKRHKNSTTEGTETKHRTEIFTAENKQKDYHKIHERQRKRTQKSTKYR